jgi:myo-inositol-1(or 4)-monophosphatase
MDVLTFGTHLAYKAGKLLLEYFHSPDLRSEIKDDNSVVTQADIATDRLITKAIQETYPNEIIISEEFPSHIPTTGSKENPLWIIDPLDGTTNFLLGLQYWGVLLAQLVKGYPETAILYFPITDEMYTAQRGKGARLNGQRIRVQPPAPERPLAFFACCSRTFRYYNVSVPYKARILGSAAYTICTVAQGISVLGFEATPKIWDIAGPWLLVEEAGGAMGTLDGSHPFPLHLCADNRNQSYPTLAAANHELLSKALQQIVLR